MSVETRELPLRAAATAGIGRCTRSDGPRGRRSRRSESSSPGPAHVARRLGQGLPRRASSTPRARSAAASSGSRTRIRGSSTGSRSPAGGSASPFVVENAPASGCGTCASAAASRAAALLPPDRSGDHAQALDRGPRGQVAEPPAGRDRSSRSGGAAALRHHDRHGRLHRQRRRQPQLLRPARRTSTSTSTPAATSRRRSSSRSTCPRCCGPSWRGRRGSASTSRWGRTPTRTSGSRAATS